MKSWHGVKPIGQPYLIPLEKAIDSIKNIFTGLWDYILKSFEGIGEGFSIIWEFNSSHTIRYI